MSVFVSALGLDDLNLYALPPAFVGLLILLLGVSALFFEKRLRVSGSFFLLAFAGALWLICYGILYAARQSDVVLLVWLAKTGHMGISFIPCLLLIFTINLVRSTTAFKRWAFTSIALSVFFFTAALYTDWWITGIKHFFWGPYPQYGPFGYFFIVYFFTALISSLLMLWNGYTRALSDRAQGRLKALLVAFAFTAAVSVDFFANFGYAVYPLGYTAILFFIVLAADTMQRYRLADVTPAFAAGKILETMQGIVLVLDMDGIIRVANNSACELLGYDRLEIIGMPARKIIHVPEKLVKGDIPFLPEQDTSLIRSYPMRWIKKDGKLLNVSVSASVMRGRSNDQAEGIVYVAQDLTERQRAEQALRESEGRFQLVVENVRDYAIFVLDPDGNVITWNLGAERIEGFTAEEIIGRHFSLFYTDEDRRNEKPQKDLAFAAERGFCENQGLRVRKDGTKFWAQGTITALKHKSGDLEGFLQITRDISELKSGEEGLRESEDRFSSVTESAHDAILSLDENGVILTWNQGAREIFGYQSAEIVGRPLSLLMPDEFRTSNKMRRISMAEHTSLLGKVVELRGVKKSAEPLPVELSLSSWKSSRGTFYSAIIRDITQRKQLQEERDRYFNLSQDMICIADGKGFFRQLNPSWEKTLGWTREELMSKVGSPGTELEFAL